MSAIEEQKFIIDKLYRLVKGSAPNGAVSVECKFEYYCGKDGSRSVNEKFSYFFNGTKESNLLEYKLNKLERPITLVPNLHKLMKAHTGGDWQAFVLTINQDGSVTTKFEYPEDDSFT